MSWTADAWDGRCPECGSPVDPEARFCEHCGVEMPKSGSRSLGDGGGSWPPPAESELVDPQASATAAHNGPDGGAATQTYLGYRLVYSDLGTDFNPLSNAAYQRALLFQFLATMAVWVIVTAAVSVLQVFVTLFQVSEQSQDLASFDTDVLSGTTALGVIVSLVCSIVLACVFWFRPLAVQLSEWMITVDDAGIRARAALEHMYLIVHNRQTPVRNLRVVRLQAARQQQRDYLRLEDGSYAGFVSSFGYGTDLYIGWTFWLSMSPAQWLWLSLRRMFRSPSDNIYVSLVNDQPKAMREVMHAAVREGVDMATGRIRPIGQGALGSTVPYTTVEA